MYIYICIQVYIIFTYTTYIYIYIYIYICTNLQNIYRNLSIVSQSYTDFETDGI